MALGGGNFTTQNKVLPGTYINFVSAARAASIMSERGIAALAVELDWGPEKTVFELDCSDLEREALSLFGYEYRHEKLKGLRDLAKHAKSICLYRLNSGEKASNTYAVAKYGGIRGNELSTVIRLNINDPEKYDVITMLAGVQVDIQTVASAEQLKETFFTVPRTDAQLSVNVGLAFTGGSNGEAVTGENYQAFLDEIEGYSFHVLGCLSEEETVKNLFAAFTKRMRDEMGIKFQTVLYDKAEDHEGIISIKNRVLGEADKVSSLVYWTTGACAECSANQSLTNALYDGEFMVDTQYTQKNLEDFISGGSFVFHKVGQEVRVLEDINTLSTYTESKGADFSANQVIRVLDQIGNDMAANFHNKYLGKVQNDEAGRTGLWNDIVTYCRKLESVRAIEDFSSDDVIVEKGENRKSVVVSCGVLPISAMTKLYMTVTVN